MGGVEGNTKSQTLKCGFHPLIHTMLEFAPALDVERIKKAEPKLRMVFEK